MNYTVGLKVVLYRVFLTFSSHQQHMVLYYP